MDEHGFIDTLRLGEGVLQDLLDSLDLGSTIDADTEVTNRRGGTDLRLPYRHPRIRLTIDHLGGGQSPFLVAGRNLTPRGLGFLHGNYLHTGTPGRVELPQTIGGMASIRCTVVWCRHVRSHIHEGAVRFDRPIDLWRHIEGADAAADLATRIDPVELEGRVLVLSKLDIMRDIIVQELSATKLRLQAFGEVEEAVESAAKEPPDIVLYDPDLDDADPADAIRRLRKTPLFCPILIATGEPSAQRIQPMRDAGANGVLRKPFQHMQLLAILMEWLAIARENADESTGANELAEKGPEYRKLVERYLAHLEQLNQELAASLDEDDFNRTRILCLRIFETAGVFGIPSLSRRAKKAMTRLDSTYSIEESGMDLQKLVQLARKVCLDGVKAPEPKPKSKAA